MVYRNETKQFWDTVYQYGGGCITRLFSGIKNFAQVCMQKSSKLLYDPLMSDINFAVPDIKILGKATTSVKKNIKSGFIDKNIAWIQIKTI